MEEVEEDDEFELDEVQDRDPHGQEWWPEDCWEPVPVQGGESLASKVDPAWKSLGLNW